MEGEQVEETDEETEEYQEATGSQQQQKKGRKGRKTAAAATNPCLGCQKNCTRAQHSVRCTLCELWCHRNCAGLSEEAFKGLEIQQKETGTAFWACRSCLGYAKKVNNQFKKMEERIDATDGRVEENTTTIKETRKLAQGTAATVKNLSDRLDRMADEMEERMDSELREREIRRHNLIIHGLAEVGDTVGGNRERMEADKKNCENVFRALGARTGANNMRFCRRIGERGQKGRPIVVGLNSEGDKNYILSRAKNLLNTDFHEVTIVPDLTKRQRSGEAKLKEEADKRNRQLSQQDLANNMRWIVVGRRGEKRLIKGIERDFTQRPAPATYSQYPQPSIRNREYRDRPTGQVQAAGIQHGQDPRPQGQYAPGPHPQSSGASQVQAAGPPYTQGSVIGQAQGQYVTGPHPQSSGASQVQVAGPPYTQQRLSQPTNQTNLPPQYQQPQHCQYTSYAPQERLSQVQVAESQRQYIQDFPALIQQGGHGQVQVANPQVYQGNNHARDTDTQEWNIMRTGAEIGPEQNGRGPNGPPPHQRGRLNSKRPLDQEEEMDSGQQTRRPRQ